MKTKKGKGAKKSLEDQIMYDKSSIKPYCKHCKHTGHWSSKCQRFDGNKCWNCGKIGHKAKDCWGKKKEKGKEKKRNKTDTKKDAEKSNLVEEHVAFMVDDELHNFDTYDACNADANDEQLIYYDWLADSATTSHITQKKEAFTNYMPLGNISVTGIGGKEAQIEGCGTVDLISTCNGQKFILHLEDVLHVPRQANLISLGRWDATGRKYMGENGKITLTSKEGRAIAQGIKISNHLYKMKMFIPQLSPRSSNIYESRADQTFVGKGTFQNWETWH